MKQSVELDSGRNIKQLDSVTYEKLCINISVALLESLYNERFLSEEAIKRIRNKAHKMVDGLPVSC